MAPSNSDWMPRDPRKNFPDRSKERNREVEHDRMGLAAIGIEGGGESPARLTPVQPIVIIISNVQLQPTTTRRTPARRADPTESPASPDEETQMRPGEYTTAPNAPARPTDPCPVAVITRPAAAPTSTAGPETAQRPPSRDGDSAPLGSADTTGVPASSATPETTFRGEEPTREPLSNPEKMAQMKTPDTKITPKAPSKS
ncbi:hypothetical protein ACJJTC_014605 [Scirpophaga incertulas]